MGFSSFHEFSEFIINRCEGSQFKFTGQGRGVEMEWRWRWRWSGVVWCGVEWCGFESCRRLVFECLKHRRFKLRGISKIMSNPVEEG